MSKKISEVPVTATPTGAKLAADVGGTDASVIVGAANGVPPLDAAAKIPVQYMPTSVVGAVEYQGTWDASAGVAPTPAPQKGWYYVVAVAGAYNLGGTTDWNVGDWAIHNGVGWEQVDNTDNDKAPLDSPDFMGSTRPRYMGGYLALRELKHLEIYTHYTLNKDDSGGVVIKFTAGAIDVTIPYDIFPLGTMITVRNRMGFNNITIRRGPGVVLRKAGSEVDNDLVLEPWGMITLEKEYDYGDSDQWVASGTGI